MFVCRECCVLSGRGLCDELITRPDESYRLWCVVCDQETSRMRWPWPALGRSATGGGSHLVSSSDSNWAKNCHCRGHVYCYVKLPLSKASRPVLGPIQHLIQLVPGLLSPGEK